VLAITNGMGGGGELVRAEGLAAIRDKLLPSLKGEMARRSGASLALQLFGIGSGFLFAVAAARLLGAHGYGLVAVALSVANVAAIVALLGSNGLAVREIATATARADWGRLRGFVRWSTWLVACTSILFGLVVAAVASVSGIYRDVLLLSAFAVPLLAGLQLVRGVNQGAHRIVAAQLPLDVIRWLLALSLMWFLIFDRGFSSPAQVLLIILFSYGISLAVASATVGVRVHALPRTAPSDASSVDWFAASVPFLTVALLGITATELNTLVLGSLAGPRDAGLYQPIAKIAPLMLMYKDAIEMPLAPRIAAMWEAGERQGLRRLIARSALASMVATSVVAAAILLASPWIFAAFGSEFESVRVYLYWIAAAQIANAAFGPSALLLAMTGDMRRRVQAQAVILIVQGVLTFALVPAFGVKGAAVALSIQMVAWAGINWALAKRSTGIDTSVLSALRTGVATRP
jgi:O-antigen/teichoic acid export membrane protein